MASIEKRARDGRTIWRAHHRAPNATRRSPAKSTTSPAKSPARRNFSSQVRHLLARLFSWVSGSAPSVVR